MSCIIVILWTLSSGSPHTERHHMDVCPTAWGVQMYVAQRQSEMKRDAEFNGWRVEPVR